MSNDVSFKIEATVDGMERVSRGIGRFLSVYDMALRGFKLLPIENGVACCVLTVIFDGGDITVADLSQSFRNALGNSAGILSVTVVPTEY